MPRDASRLIDANSNRASEAARTLEDLARFMLDDGPLAARWKQTRHGLAAALHAAGLPRATLAMARDTANDAGTANSAADAHSRADLEAVASAAASRLGEALRVVEEALKLSAPSAAAAVERLRYDAYDAEKLLFRRLAVPRPHWPVCVLVTESLCVHHSWLDVAQAAIDGGAACIQLREKELTDRELLGRACTLIELARPRDVAVVINDRADIAALAGADGVHLGQDDLSVAGARRIVGERCIVGVSCSTPEQANAAASDGADTIGIGAMYSTATKAKPRIAGPDLLRAVIGQPELAVMPHLAIGGIDADRAAELVSIGCRGVAVSSAVCGATDPRAAVAAVVEVMGTMAEPPHASEGAAE